MEECGKYTKAVCLRRDIRIKVVHFADLVENSAWYVKLIVW